jgi:fatty-acyl-CoA synthase
MIPTAGDLLRATARRHGGRTALIDATAPTRRWTWAELEAEVEATARLLAGAHRPGAAVAIRAQSEPAWVVLELACLVAGLTVQPVDPALDADAVVDAIRRTGAAALATGHDDGSGAVLGAVRSELPEVRTLALGGAIDGFPARSLPVVRPTDGALLLPTSGTTGRPKSALLSHSAVTTDARLVAGRMGLRCQDTWLTVMPLHRSGGCSTTVMACTATGATMVCSPAWSADVVLDLLRSTDATVLSAFPRALQALVDAVDELPPVWRPRGVLLVQTGGAPVAPALVHSTARLLGARLSVVYGLTEASPVLTQTDQRDPDDDPSASVGRPLPGTDLMIVDPEDGAPLATGALGEVVARGPQLMDGYAGDLEATARAIDCDGWLHTGDMGWLDEHGRLHVEGRLADMITRRGERWLPGPVERVLVEAGVAEAVVVGALGPTADDEVVAFVRRHPRQSADADELRAAVARHCGPERMPDRIVFLDELPALPSGKVRRFVLRQMTRSR